MNLREYIKALEEMAKEDPALLDMPVVYSRDDEGNGFQKVGFLPESGRFDSDTFVNKSAFEEWGYSEDEVNAICIN